MKLGGLSSQPRAGSGIALAGRGAVERGATMDADYIVSEVLGNPEVLLFVCGTTIALTAIVFSSVSNMVRSTSRERTRREVAAYIAAGSMTPEQGERLIRSGGNENKCA